mmetsp:Transcript_117690/g.340247  ORF Transcript_117690/g.340247 Transcript_117690/m.340247 type:complete len:207 (+) Transcript_117690:355-975(+)
MQEGRHAHAAEPQRGGAEPWHGSAVGGAPVCWRRRELHGVAVLPRRRAPVLQEKRVLGVLQAGLQHRAGPEGQERHLVVQDIGPSGLGLGHQGLALALLHHPLYAGQLRGPLAETPARDERRHLWLRWLRHLRGRAVHLGQDQGRHHGFSDSDPEDQGRRLSGRHRRQRETLHGRVGQGHRRSEVQGLRLHHQGGPRCGADPLEDP